MSTARKATLIIDGQEPVEFPILKPASGNNAAIKAADFMKSRLFIAQP